ncbi:MAG: hypothetical protein ACI9AP_000586, partial [Flavobacteriales bacterium]
WALFCRLNILSGTAALTTKRLFRVNRFET